MICEIRCGGSVDLSLGDRACLALDLSLVLPTLVSKGGIVSNLLFPPLFKLLKYTYERIIIVNSITLDLSPVIKLTDEEYYKLATAHDGLRMERTPKGEIEIMPPTGGNTGKRNADLTTDLNIWNRRTKLGVVFDSSTEFNLPNGGDRSPDASWIQLERWNALSQAQQDVFPPICPDFVIELKSPSDSWKKLQQKMQEYLDSGLCLGWLINPENRSCEIYRQGREKEVLENPAALSGEDVLPGFVLDLQTIFG